MSVSWLGEVFTSQPYPLQHSFQNVSCLGLCPPEALLWACRTAHPLDRVIFSTLSGTIFAISSPWVCTLLSVLAWPASLLDCKCFFQLFWPRQPLHSRLVGTGPLQPYAWFQILAAPPLRLLPWGVMKHLYASASSAVKWWWKTDLPHKEATRATK